MSSARRIQAALLTALISLGALVAWGSAPAQAAETATVSILHAVPDATVDVYANGKALVKNYKPGTLTKPAALRAGTYDLKVVKAGAGPKGAAIITLDDAKVPAGANLTVVAHLDADGKPMLSAYSNDLSKVPAGKARLIVRHVAAAPAVDVRANGKAVFSDLSNPDQVDGEVAAGTVEGDVVLAGTDTVAIGPASLNLREGTVTIVYAWGSAKDKNLKLAVQMHDGMHSDPNAIPGGTGGQAAHGSLSRWAAALALLGAGGVALSAGQLARVRQISGR